MHKIVSLFNAKKRSVAQLESEFPTLSPQEEQEIFKALGVQPQRDEHAKDVIVGTLRRLHTSRSRGSSAEGTASAIDEESESFDSEGFVDVGTVRVKDWDGNEVMGTVRVKEGQQWGTISVKNMTAPWMGSATIRIANDDVEQALSEGSVQLQSTEDKAAATDSPQWMNAMREPEEWELSILALEKGEWIPEMDKNAEAFRKYKKERKQLNNLFEGPQRKRSNAVLTAMPASAAGTKRSNSEREKDKESKSSLEQLLNAGDRKSSAGKKGKKKELKGLEKALAEMK